MGHHRTNIVLASLPLALVGLIGLTLWAILVDVPLILAVGLSVICAWWGLGTMMHRRAENTAAPNHAGLPTESGISQKHLRDLLQSVSDAIISTDLDFNIVTWNRAAEQLYGWQLDDVLGRRVDDVTQVAYPNHDPAAVLNEFLTNGYWEGEIIQYHRDGTPLYIHSRVSRLVDAQNTPQGAVSINRNVTPLKQAEQALRDSETRYRSIVNDALNRAASGVLIVDAALVIVWVNRALEEFLGIDRAELLSQDIRACLGECIAPVFEDSADFAARVEATYGDNTYNARFECHVLAEGDRGERWLEHISQPIREGWYAGGRIEHYYDITRRKHAEQRLLANQNELEQRVLARTADLVSMNTELQREIAERAQLEARLKQHNHELVTLQRVFELAFSGQSASSAYDAIAAEISTSTGFSTVMIKFYNEPRQIMEFIGAHFPPDFTDTPPKMIPVKESLTGTVVRTGLPQVELNPLDRAEYAHPLLHALQIQTFVCVPMLANEQVIGTLSLCDAVRCEVNEHFMDWLKTLGNYIASLLLHKQAWEREIALLEQLATGSTTITARALGVARLRQQVPAIFDEMIDRFAGLLELALERSLFKVEHNVTDGLRIMAERLGFVRAGPRDVIEIYSTALRRVTEPVSTSKAQAYTEEGRLLVLELMGHLVSYYRLLASGSLPDQDHQPYSDSQD